jgi:hypothetical protein
VLRHTALDSAGRNDVAGLPKSYIAVSLAYTDALPESPENQTLLSELLRQLAAEDEVVIVDDPVPGHVDVHASSRVRSIASLAGDLTALQLQTTVVARARAFVGGFGDLAILAAFCGRPVTAYHSERLPADQFERVQAAAPSGWGTLTLERARVKGLRQPLKAHA